MILKELVEQLLQTAGIAGLSAPVSANGQRIERVAFGCGRVWIETEGPAEEDGERLSLPALRPPAVETAWREALRTCLHAYRRGDADLLEEAMEEAEGVLEE